MFPALQANTKFNSRWTTDEQLLAVQGGLDGGERAEPQASPPILQEAGAEEKGRGRNSFYGALTLCCPFDPHSHP